MNSSFILSIAFLVIYLNLFNFGLAEAQKRIINGQEAEEYIPYVAYITSYNSEYFKLGGGTFVSYNHLVTAATKFTT